MAQPATASARVKMAALPKPQGIVSTAARKAAALLRNRYCWLALLCLPLAASAQQGIPALNSMPAPGGGTNYSLPIQTILLLTSLSFLPAALLMMTCFTRIVIVLSLLRQALGTQSTPPTQVLVGLSLFLTFFVMSPVFDRIYTDAYQPFAENKIQMMEALDKGAQPLKEFMLKQTRESDLALYVKLSRDRKSVV